MTVLAESPPPSLEARIHGLLPALSPAQARIATEVLRDSELADRARVSLAAAGYEAVHVAVGNGWLGLPEHAPYDGIAVAAAAQEMPPALLEQVREGRRIALPIGRRNQQLCVLERTVEGARLLASIPVRFVPLVGGKNESPE